MPIVTREEIIISEKISQSALGNFNRYGRNAPKPIKLSYDMELGKLFEGVIRYLFDKTYTLPYYAQENANKRLFDAILEGRELDGLIRIKKDGNPYSDDVALADQIEVHKTMGGKLPIDKADWDMVDSLVEKMLYTPCLNDILVKEFLDRAEFDVCVETGEDKGILDVISTLEDEEGRDPISVAFDFKLYASESAFLRSFRDRLWIQERHYARLLGEYCKEKGSVPYPNLVFLCAYKDVELCQYLPLEETQENYDRAEIKYINLWGEYINWVADGKKETGYLKPRYLRVW